MLNRRTVATSVLVVVFAATTGCANLPSAEVMKAETVTYQLPKMPETGKAIVYVVRPSPSGGLVRFNVFVDDQEATSEVGYTRSSQYIYFNLAPGDHKIYSKAENWAELQVKAAAGDVIYIQQETSMGLVMARNSIFKLEEIPGKYQVKKLTVGTILKAEK